MNQSDKPNSPQPLVGGYATGNLTPEERDRMFRSALQDQGLFDSLMEEQDLKDLLDEPGVKAELARKLRPSAWETFRQWWLKPIAWGTAGAVATACLVVAYLANQPKTMMQPSAKVVAEVVSQAPVSEAPLPAPKVDEPPKELRRAQPRLESARVANQAPASGPPPAALDKSRDQAPLKDEVATAQRQDQDVRMRVPPPASPPPQSRSRAEPAAEAPKPAVMAQADRKAEIEKKEIAGRSQEQGEVRSTLAVDTPRRNEEQAAKQVAVGGVVRPASAKSAAAVYTLLKVGADGSTTPVRPGEAVDPVRRFLFQMQHAESGSITIVRRDEAGTTNILVSEQPVHRGQLSTVPLSGGFRLATGPQTLQIQFTPAPEAEREADALERQGFRSVAPGRGKTAVAKAREASAPRVIHEIRVVGRLP